MTVGLDRVPGVPESTLPARVLSTLPVTTPGAPWETVVEAVVWAHRASPDARDLLPPELRDRVVAEVTVGAFLRYLASPVGTYHEVLASPLLVRPRPGVTVPFIAVDSLASVHGGRAHWALPKAVAQFDWAPGVSGTARAAGDGWSVSAHPRALPVSVPLAAWFSLTQVGADGDLLSTRVRAGGWGRAARVEVHTAGATLPAWLRSGRHGGLVVRRARQVVGRPRRG